MPIGENCKVKHPKSGYEYNLTPLAGKDYEVKDLSYEYHFAVCGPVTSSVCPHGPSNSVSSCQVEGSAHRIAGEFVLFSIKTELVGHFFSFMFKRIVNPKIEICWKCTHPQAVQDVDEFDSSSEQMKNREI